MADPLELNHSDYKAIIEFCEGCAGTFTIKDYINDRIKKYKGSNKDMILFLMQHIEKLNPKIRYDPDDPNPFYKWEILNFDDDEHPKWIKSPHVEYLYSYLCFLLDRPKEVNKIMGVEENGLTIYPDKAFNTGLDRKSLSDLFAHLVKFEFLEKRSETNFLKIFSNESLKDIDAIRWLGEYRNGADMQTLFEVIKHLCSWEYTDVERKIFFNKINDCFRKYNGEVLGFTNIRTNFSRWKKDVLTSEILRTPDYRKKQYLLIKYLQEFPTK